MDGITVNLSQPISVPKARNAACISTADANKILYGNARVVGVTKRGTNKANDKSAEFQPHDLKTYTITLLNSGKINVTREQPEFKSAHFLGDFFARLWDENASCWVPRAKDAEARLSLVYEGQLLVEAKNAASLSKTDSNQVIRKVKDSDSKDGKRQAIFRTNDNRSYSVTLLDGEITVNRQEANSSITDFFSRLFDANSSCWTSRASNAQKQLQQHVYSNEVEQLLKLSEKELILSSTSKQDLKNFQIDINSNGRLSVIREQTYFQTFVRLRNTHKDLLAQSLKLSESGDSHSTSPDGSDESPSGSQRSSQELQRFGVGSGSNTPTGTDSSNKSLGTITTTTTLNSPSSGAPTTTEIDFEELGYGAPNTTQTQVQSTNHSTSQIPKVETSSTSATTAADPSQQVHLTTEARTKEANRLLILSKEIEVSIRENREEIRSDKFPEDSDEDNWYAEKMDGPLGRQGEYITKLSVALTSLKNLQRTLGADLSDVDFNKVEQNLAEISLKNQRISQAVNIDRFIYNDKRKLNDNNLAKPLFTKETQRHSPKEMQQSITELRHTAILLNDLATPLTDEQLRSIINDVDAHKENISTLENRHAEKQKEKRIWESEDTYKIPARPQSYKDWRESFQKKLTQSSKTGASNGVPSVNPVATVTSTTTTTTLSSQATFDQPPLVIPSPTSSADTTDNPFKDSSGAPSNFHVTTPPTTPTPLPKSPQKSSAKQPREGSTVNAQSKQEVVKEVVANPNAAEFQPSSPKAPVDNNNRGHSSSQPQTSSPVKTPANNGRTPASPLNPNNPFNPKDLSIDTNVGTGNNARTPSSIGNVSMNPFGTTTATNTPQSSAAVQPTDSEARTNAFIDPVSTITALKPSIDRNPFSTTNLANHSSVSISAHPVVVTTTSATTTTAKITRQSLLDHINKSWNTFKYKGVFYYEDEGFFFKSRSAPASYYSIEIQKRENWLIQIIKQLENLKPSNGNTTTGESAETDYEKLKEKVDEHISHIRDWEAKISPNEDNRQEYPVTNDTYEAVPELKAKSANEKKSS